MIRFFEIRAMRSGRSIQTLIFRGLSMVLLCINLLSTMPAAVGQTTAPANGASLPAVSPYVERMMLLDRNGDRLLDLTELPGALRKLVQAHDSDADQKLSAAELSVVEADAGRTREKSSPLPSVPNAVPRRMGRSSGTALQGSPLDAEQILRFALTFDGNRDGSLDAEELKRYSVALAARRAQSRVQRGGDESANPPTSAELPGANKSGRRGGVPPLTNKPSAGLGADGKGDGGFGDPAATKP